MLDQIKAKAIELTGVVESYLPQARTLAPKVAIYAPVVLLPLFVGLVLTAPKAPATPPSVTVTLPAPRPFDPSQPPNIVVGSQQVVKTETKIVYVQVPATTDKPATMKPVVVQVPVVAPSVTVANTPPVTPPVQQEPSKSPQLDQVFTQPPPPAKPEPRSVAVTPVQYISGSKIQPSYPDGLRAAGIQGEVSVRVTVGPDGRPRSIKPIGKSDSRLAGYVQKFGMKNWRFKPATVDGLPSTGNIDVSMNFKLTGD